MRALTVTQPFATLISLGQKKIETRSWSTSFRGPLAIHAGKGLGPVGGMRGLMLLGLSQPFAATLLAAGYGNPARLPLGAIVATCELVDCLPTRQQWKGDDDSPWFTGARRGVGQHYYEVPPPVDSNERAFGDYSPGRFAWLLADVRALPEPIPTKGALGLWSVNTPTQLGIKRQQRELEASDG